VESPHWVCRARRRRGMAGPRATFEYAVTVAAN
jgi:hypothetical protein